MIRSVDIHVDGIVQGVGFRPFVFRIARRNLVSGWVLNSASGVDIHVEGEPALISSFISDLKKEAPSASKIESIAINDSSTQGCCGFEIRHSKLDVSQDEESTSIPPDMATCSKCLEELFDPLDPRYRYPFINCTECGPRFTIIEGLPYDRPKTSMSSFEMCPDCAREYLDPADRRFHAQPNACFECGPSLTLIEVEEKAGVANTNAANTTKSNNKSNCSSKRQASDAAISRAVQIILDGGIVAEKGLGGYHLACDATNEAAVVHLRTRKRREGKPLALMVSNLDMARQICCVDSIEASLMSSPECPIVLLQRLDNPQIKVADSVAPGLSEIGLMLPCTPLQHLLMHELARPIVMTSGNISTEPIIADNTEAHKFLWGVADVFLDNNRPIVSRYDDSVTRVVDQSLQMVRRARGYAPAPLGFPSFNLQGIVLATGPEQKSTFCLSNGARAFVSQHIGDLESIDAWESWERTLALYQQIFGLVPTALACDMHPEYLSTKWAKRQTERGGDFEGRSLIQVQHHHAHIAAVIGEHIAAGDLDPELSVLGIALDGTGYGTDQTIWGGELLVCDTRGFERLGSLKTMSLAGGRGAIEHPCRMAYSLIREIGMLDHPGAAHVLEAVGESSVELLDSMLASGAGCIKTSSCGRLLDAISSILGICDNASFDGQAPMLLEAAAHAWAAAHAETAAHAGAVEHAGVSAQAGAVTHTEAAAQAWIKKQARKQFSLPAPIEQPKDSQMLIDWHALIASVLDCIANGYTIGEIAFAVHLSLCQSFAKMCELARNKTGISTVALSGGVMANRIVFEELSRLLNEAGFKVLSHIELPPNDGCISYGQAVVASARLAHGIAI